MWKPPLLAAASSQQAASWPCSALPLTELARAPAPFASKGSEGGCIIVELFFYISVRREEASDGTGAGLAASESMRSRGHLLCSTLRRKLHRNRCLLVRFWELFLDVFWGEMRVKITAQRKFMRSEGTFTGQGARWRASAPRRAVLAIKKLSAMRLFEGRVHEIQWLIARPRAYSSSCKSKPQHSKPAAPSSCNATQKAAGQLATCLFSTHSFLSRSRRRHQAHRYYSLQPAATKSLKVEY